MRPSGSTAFPHRRRSGVTLLELLLGLLALVLVVFVVLPWARGAMAGLEAASAADAVADAMAEARSLAKSRGREVRLSIDAAGPDLDVEGGEFRRLSSGVRLSGPPPAADGDGIILFHPDGSSDGGQVVVATGGMAWSLTVDRRTGLARRVFAGRR
jgi:general secretion pathway protein H